MPYVYADAEECALMSATTSLRPALHAATYRTLLGLLAVSGMRLGEVIRLDRPDLDTAEAVVNRRLVQERLLIYCGAVPAPGKVDEETRARAVRLYTDRLRDHGESKLTARKHVGALLDINPATLRNWIEAERRAAAPAGVAINDSDTAAEMRRLRQENAELRRANEILKTASAFFAQAELDRRLK